MKMHGIGNSFISKMIPILGSLAHFILSSIGALSGISLGGRLSSVLLAGGLLLLVFVVFVILAILSGDRMLALADKVLCKRQICDLKDRLLGIVQDLLAGFTAVGRQPKGLVQMVALSFLSALLDGMLRADWIRMIETYPDRFTVGSDQFFTGEGATIAGPPSLDATWQLLSYLPQDLQRQIACENAFLIYKLE